MPVLDPIALLLWAKTDPYHPLWCHLIDVGRVTQALLETPAFAATVRRLRESSGCPDSFISAWLGYVTALHDIGKCHHDFQGKEQGAIIRPLEENGLRCVVQDKRYRHEGLSAVWVQDFLQHEFGWPNQTSRVVSDVLRGHHGDFGAPTPESPEFQREKWEALRSSLEAIVRRVFRPDAWCPVEFDQSVFGLLLSGLLVWSDWIASNAEMFPLRGGQADIDGYAAQSAAVAAKAVSGLGLTVGNPWQKGEAFLETWRTLGVERARPVQRRCEEMTRSGLSPGLCIIEAPMGEGKTEAALYLATQWAATEGRNGLYVALPTAATSNQMFGRFKAFLSDRDPLLAAGARLVHGQAWLVQEDEAAPTKAPELAEVAKGEAFQALEWFRPKKRSLLASYGVGTIDQALFSVLHVKHGFLRLFGLSGKVLIVDEVHAYDPYMSRILTRLLRWCRSLRIPVILLSATLPEVKRRALVEAYAPEAPAAQRPPGELAPYPLITLADETGSVREERVEGAGRCQEIKLNKHYGLLGKSEETAGLALSLVERGGCLCVLVNTVDTAQRIYEAIKSRLPKDDPCQLMLFHARFRAGRRRGIEEEALRLFGKRSLLPQSDPDYVQRPPKAILVATQVVEQSLDLDFDEMITEIAPVDLLLQRAGRLHRHARSERPTGTEARLHIMWPEKGAAPDFQKVEHVYQRFILLKTISVLALKNELTLPDDIRLLVERVYDGREWGAEDCVVSTEEDFRKAWKQACQEDEDDREAAKQYLIPEPSERAFRLASMRQGTFDEDEGGGASYFNACTRLGDDTRSVLILEGDAWAKELESKTSAARRALSEIMLCSANLPAYWFHGVEAEDGFAGLDRGPSWLPGQLILRLRGGVWLGRKGGKRITIRDDEYLGLILEKEV